MKVIDNYLDKYYARKLAKALKLHLTLEHWADCRICVYSGVTSIEAKLGALDKTYYTSVFSFHYHEALTMLCDIELVQEMVARAYKNLIERQKKELL